MLFSMKTCGITISLILQLATASLLWGRNGMKIKGSLKNYTYIEGVASDSIPLDSSSQTGRSCFSPIGLQNIPNNSVENYFGSFGTQAPSNYRGGKSLGGFQVNGLFRFVSIYRDMQKSYADMQTSKRNISFFDYPLSDILTSGGYGNPMLALALTSNVNKNASFRISYSISHLFTGSSDNKVNKFFNSFGGIAFEGNIKKDPVTVNFKFGGLLTMRVSRLVFDAPKYRTNYFDRVVSNNYSVGKFESQYGKEEETRFFLTPYIRGGILKLNFPGVNNLQVLGMYGRTSNTYNGVFTPNGTTNADMFPAVNYLLRVATPYSVRGNGGKFAINYYAKNANTDAVHNIKDNMQLFSTDFDIKLGTKVSFLADLGLCQINNPLVRNVKWGKALIMDLVLDKKLIGVPLKMEYYNIDHAYGNLDGEVLNSNVALMNGGVTGNPQTNQTLFINTAQEVGMAANNRAGVNLTSAFNIKNLKIDIGYAVSQEKQNIYDSISFQHRVNAFSRSRFWQWRQGIGPYNRIRSIYARTFELITINDKALGNSTDYKKGFNNLEFLMRYEANIFNKRFIFANFSNFVSIQDHLAISPVFTTKAFIRTFFNDFTAICKLTNKFMIIGNFGLERVLGNTRVNLSPDKITDASGNPYADKDRIINQTGYAVGAGFGIDLSSNTTFNFRSKWMYHKDKNFLQDQFQGTETTIELKIFI